jgi:VWFA-related protein
MFRAVSLLALFGALANAQTPAQAPTDPDVVFRSDVSLVRVDAQVVDASNRAIIHLHENDFVLREDGRVVPIRNFAADNMPIDVLFLLDVSSSMRPHVQRIADASGQALMQMNKDDRMAIMVFDTYTRVRLPFNSSHQEVQRAFDRLLREEGFRGGTDITRGMFDAADYIRREGRRDARRAIVILTDDQTNAQYDVDEAGVGRALARADAVMCALIAPDASQYMGRGGGGQRPGGMGGGGLGGPLGGIIFGRGGGGGYPGGGYPGAGRRGGGDKPAGAAEIARDSGGDSMSVNESSALEDTLERLRQRYTLYFSLPEGVQPGDERNIQVDLSPEARRRFSDAEVRYRRAYMSSHGDRENTPVKVTHAPSDNSYPTSSSSAADAPDSNATPTHHKRVAVNEDGTAVSSPDQQ